MEREVGMRRVVVTGLGVVSSVGNNANEVLASLREARSGVAVKGFKEGIGELCGVKGLLRKVCDGLFDFYGIHGRVAPPLGEVARFLSFCGALMSYVLSCVFSAICAAIQRSNSLRRNRQVPPSLNPGISPCWASRYTVFFPALR